MADEAHSEKSSLGQKALGVGALTSLVVTATGFAGPEQIASFAEKVGIPFTILVAVLWSLKAGFAWFARVVVEPWVKSQREFVHSVAEQNKVQSEAVVEIKTAITKIGDLICQQAEDHKSAITEFKNAVERQTQRFVKDQIKDVA